jgi:hypothetical protein
MASSTATFFPRESQSAVIIDRQQAKKKKEKHFSLEDVGWGQVCQKKF